ncbi:hypothetical protein JB92DRAFT_1459377 [Gautieria morchelliformis]|nr:hypothetical protein JB92DRAFT_1459377 [Gautieria morchelliformis]
MIQHNQGTWWVLGSLCLLLYMGSLGLGVVLAVKNGCNVTAADLGFLNLRSREFHIHPRKSLTQTLAAQSLIRYGITLASGITAKVLRLSPLLT